MIFASNFTELDYSNKSILSSAVIRFVAISTNFNYSRISLFFIIYDRLKLNNQLIATEIPEIGIKLQYNKEYKQYNNNEYNYQQSQDSIKLSQTLSKQHLWNENPQINRINVVEIVFLFKTFEFKLQTIIQIHLSVNI
ncbi:Hypothetical_protein [Hexamita inflata]|uniref:Hypothetical_protein n=1 Tax=Hexamita inflata TaxID=28002 RepID=A0AA86UMJ8_9EUKA|nr:Hypothetical protein HINF_LOCUS44866 [Hexamita inflata]